MEDSYPRTSRSFYYIGVFVFGAGIFLIGQMFNLSEGIYADFFMWGLGVLPLAYYLKDKLISAAVALFFIIYGFTVFGWSCWSTLSASTSYSNAILDE